MRQEDLVRLEDLYCYKDTRVKSHMHVSGCIYIACMHAHTYTHRNPLAPVVMARLEPYSRECLHGILFVMLIASTS